MSARPDDAIPPSPPTPPGPVPMAADTAPALHIDGPRATLTLRRPGHHNRIDPADIDVIRAHVATAQATPGVRLLVLTGSGAHSFSSGYTIEAILSHLDDSFQAMLDELERCPLPTMAALNGSVYGGGCDLALCCDWRIGVSGSRMFVPASRIGLHYYPGGLRRFTTALGPAAAKKIFLTALPLEADEMLRIGFLQELVAPQALEAAVERYAQALAEAEPGAVASMKRDIDRHARGDLDETAGREAYRRSLASPALAQRLRARR